MSRSADDLVSRWAEIGKPILSGGSRRCGVERGINKLSQICGIGGGAIRSMLQLNSGNLTKFTLPETRGTFMTLSGRESET